MRALFGRIGAALRARKERKNWKELAQVREKFNEELADSLIRSNRERFALIKKRDELEAQVRDLVATRHQLEREVRAEISRTCQANDERDQARARVVELERLLGPRPLPGKAVL
jgi:hypothetical protein